MYTFGSRIRYSETDEYGKLTLTGIMNYLQDCSTFQSEDRAWDFLSDRTPSGVVALFLADCD